MSILGFLDNWVDLAAALTVGLFCLYGVIRGLTIQMVGLLVLLAALVAAHAASPVLGLWIRNHVWEQVFPGVSRGISFVLVALCVLVLSSLVFHLIFGRFAAKARMPMDRFFGGVLGAAKGALILMAVLALSVNALWDIEEAEPPGGLLRDLLASDTAELTVRVSRGLVRILPAGAAAELQGYVDPLVKGTEAEK